MNMIARPLSDKQPTATLPVVLFVDDDPDILRGISRALRQQPFVICTACSAEEAIYVLKAHRVALVISDENLPGMCGTKFLSWVADNYPEVKRIVLTGQPNLPSALRAINESQVFRYFTKPCDILELAFAIRDALEQ